MDAETKKRVICGILWHMTQGDCCTTSKLDMYNGLTSVLLLHDDVFLEATLEERVAQREAAVRKAADGKENELAYVQEHIAAAVRGEDTKLVATADWNLTNTFFPEGHRSAPGFDYDWERKLWENPHVPEQLCNSALNNEFEEKFEKKHGDDVVDFNIEEDVFREVADLIAGNRNAADRAITESMREELLVSETLVPMPVPDLPKTEKHGRNEAFKRLVELMKSNRTMAPLNKLFDVTLEVLLRYFQKSPVSANDIRNWIEHPDSRERRIQNVRAAGEWVVDNCVEVVLDMFKSAYNFQRGQAAVNHFKRAIAERTTGVSPFESLKMPRLMNEAGETLEWRRVNIE